VRLPQPAACEVPTTRVGLVGTCGLLLASSWIDRLSYPRRVPRLVPALRCWTRAPADPRRTRGLATNGSTSAGFCPEYAQEARNYFGIVADRLLEDAVVLDAVVALLRWAVTSRAAQLGVCMPWTLAGIDQAAVVLAEQQNRTAFSDVCRLPSGQRPLTSHIARRAPPT